MYFAGLGAQYAPIWSLDLCAYALVCFNFNPNPLLGLGRRSRSLLRLGRKLVLVRLDERGDRRRVTEELAPLLGIERHRETLEPVHAQRTLFRDLEGQRGIALDAQRGNLGILRRHVSLKPGETRHQIVGVRHFSTTFLRGITPEISKH